MVMVLVLEIMVVQLLVLAQQLLTERWLRIAGTGGSGTSFVVTQQLVFHQQEQ